MKKKNYTFKMSPEIIEKAKKLAKKANRSMGNFIETLLIRELQRNEE